MKSSMMILGLLVCTSAASAQQSATVQMQCRDISSNGNYLGPDEVLVNGMACHPVKQASPQNQTATPRESLQTPPATVQTPGAGSTSAAAPVVAGSSALVPATLENMKIASGAKVYIVPMDGFENYLAAALGKKKVELVPVFDQNQADYVISGTSVDKKAGWAKIAFMGNIHSDNSASITMTDKHTGAIVYAYAVDKKSTLHGQQTTAEACAKHLKAHMEGHQ